MGAGPFRHDALTQANAFPRAKEAHMAVSYKVEAFVPEIKGCAAKDKGWDETRCGQFQDFLNSHTAGGWSLHSSEYRSVTVQGCSGGGGSWLVCVFEKEAA